MRNVVHKVYSLYLLISTLILGTISCASDAMNTTKTIKDGETLVSAGGIFELGFFSPANSTKRYVGIWYRSIVPKTVVWVANRETPVMNRLAFLKVIRPGILILLNHTNGTVWSSEASRSAQNPVAQLLDSGNLVVRESEDDRPEKFLWQGFDFPTDTLLPGMKLGRSFETGVETYLSSWKSRDDPARGEFSIHLDPSGYPQVIVKRFANVKYRAGPWNGIRFSGQPSMKGDRPYTSTFMMNNNEVYYEFNTINPSFLTRFVINETGGARSSRWDDRTDGWLLVQEAQEDECDNYMLCGSYGSCDAEKSPVCRCLDRFSPYNPSEWNTSDWSSGCVRRKHLSCVGDVFLKYSKVKLPDARNALKDPSMTLEECREACLQNCSCIAYTQLDTRKKVGCLFWYGDLKDIRTLSEDGEVIYIRMASSEIDDSKAKERRILIASSMSIVGIVILCAGLFLCRWKMKNSRDRRREGKSNGYPGEEMDVPFFKLSTIIKATNHFSIENKLGEGGFGPVYKGILEDGQEIAVKKLSKYSSQGFDELKNEVVFIAKLQHRNLVKLLGFCKQGDESLLVYEYMPMKSLDFILFDKTKRISISWKEWLHIINGIARGLMYLHQDSRLRIIHRDLKASNILLDSDMNPKISDFGLARSFGGNEVSAKTRRVVGTYGYMSPEYAVEGLFSTKSDVYSFGVLVLEIVSGKRNWGFSHHDHDLNLLGHAWMLYQEGRILELVDACIDGSENFHEVVRQLKSAYYVCSKMWKTGHACRLWLRCWKMKV